MGEILQVQRLTPTELRANLYRTLDSVAQGATVVLIERDGVELQISRRQGPSLLKNLPKRNTLVCTADELVEHTWIEPWGTEL